MVYKYSFIASGQNFYPSRLIPKFTQEIIVENYTDYGLETNKNFEYLDGRILFWHPKKYSTNDSLQFYEEQFVSFIQKNYSIFVEAGAVDFEIFMEVYYDVEQCNFEIFDRDKLKILSAMNISLPISIYAIGKSKLKRWEKEIIKDWEK